jgi:hypothetical protein
VKRIVVLVLLAAAVAAPAARADGDPASDFLLTYQVFYPYYSNTPKASLKELTTTVADANKRGYTIRVAVITSPYDLGSLSALWGKPQPYASFLALELGIAYRGRLLVVTPKGYGYNDKTTYVNKTYVAHPSKAKLAVVRTVPIGKGTDGLLQTADRAVRALAAKDGVRLPAVHASTTSSSSSDTIVIGIAAAAGILLVAGAEFARRSRRRRRLSPSAEEGGHA